MGRLEGKVALVTGAGSGIGRQTALPLRRGGRRGVAVADLRGDTAEETAAGICAAGGGATACTMDVTRSAESRPASQAAIEAFGGVDVVVNNAGITIIGAAHDLERGRLGPGARDQPQERLPRLQGAVAALRGARRRVDRVDGLDRRHLGDPRRRRVLRLQGGRDHAHEVPGARRREGGHPRQLRLPGLHPDADDRRLLRRPARSRRRPAQFAVGLHPLGRLGEPLDIADGFVYLASDEARWVTGTALVVDGGLTAGIWGG